MHVCHLYMYAVIVFWCMLGFVACILLFLYIYIYVYIYFFLFKYIQCSLACLVSSSFFTCCTKQLQLALVSHIWMFPVHVHTLGTTLLSPCAADLGWFRSTGVSLNEPGLLVPIYRVIAKLRSCGLEPACRSSILLICHCFSGGVHVACISFF